MWTLEGTKLARIWCFYSQAYCKTSGDKVPFCIVCLGFIHTHGCFLPLFVKNVMHCHYHILWSGRWNNIASNNDTKWSACGEISQGCIMASNSATTFTFVNFLSHVCWQNCCGHKPVHSHVIRLFRGDMCFLVFSCTEERQLTCIYTHNLPEGQKWRTVSLFLPRPFLECSSRLVCCIDQMCFPKSETERVELDQPLKKIKRAFQIYLSSISSIVSIPVQCLSK